MVASVTWTTRKSEGLQRRGLENLHEQMKAREEEHAVPKGELEAQRQHTENASEKIKVLEEDRMSRIFSSVISSAMLSDMTAR